jgi:hypothetical protein
MVHIAATLRTSAYVCLRREPEQGRGADWVVGVVGRDSEEDVRMGLQRLVAWLEVKMKSDDERALWMEELIVPLLRGDFSHLQAATMLEMVVSCLEDDPNRRPSMNAVLQKLLSPEDAALVRYT